MDLVLDQVVELQHVDVAHGDLAVEGLAGATVVEDGLPAPREVGGLQLGADLALGRPVEDGSGRLLAGGMESPAKVGLQDLADVHPARHAERVEDDVDRRAVRQEGHVLLGQDPGDHALVAVTPGHLVAHADLPLLGNRNADEPVHARQELVAALAAELADVDHLPALAVRQAEAGVLHLAGLLAEDRPQETLLRGEFGLALGGDLPDEDVARLHLRPDVDDSVLVQVLEGVLADVRNVAGDLLRAELRVAGLHLVLLDVDAGEEVLARPGGR